MGTIWTFALLMYDLFLFHINELNSTSTPENN